MSCGVVLEDSHEPATALTMSDNSIRRPPPPIRLLPSPLTKKNRPSPLPSKPVSLPPCTRPALSCPPWHHLVYTPYSCTPYTLVALQSPRASKKRSGSLDGSQGSGADAFAAVCRVLGCTGHPLSPLCLFPACLLRSFPFLPLPSHPPHLPLPTCPSPLPCAGLTTQAHCCPQSLRGVLALCTPGTSFWWTCLLSCLQSFCGVPAFPWPKAAPSSTPIAQLLHSMSTAGCADCSIIEASLKALQDNCEHWGRIWGVQYREG